MDTNTESHRRTREAIAAQIRARRAYLRMSQGDVVTNTGLSRSTISRIENGDRDLDVPQLVAICAALDVSPADLLQAAMRSIDGTGD